MHFDDYYESYLLFICNRFSTNEDAKDEAIDDMERYDPDEWEYRGEFRAALVADGNFTECQVSSPSGICQVAGTLCDHPMTAHDDVYWMN